MASRFTRVGGATAVTSDALDNRGQARWPAAISFNSSSAQLVWPIFCILCLCEILIQQPRVLDSALHLSKVLPRGKLAWAIADEAAHGIAAGSIWLTVVLAHTTRRTSCKAVVWSFLVGFFVGISIDVDHYVWGALLFGDISVERARHLGEIRPLPHCVPIMIVCAIFAAAAVHRITRRLHISHGLDVSRPARGWLMLFLVAWGLHLLRDGIHRGVWLFPTSTVFSTGLVHPLLYIAAACIAPLGMLRVLPAAKFRNHGSSKNKPPA